MLDGTAYSAMAGLTQNYVTPYALEMKATTQQIGLLASIPNFTMALSQLLAPRLAERVGSRKSFILPAALMHALMFLPMLLVPYLADTNQVWWLILFHTLGTAFDSVSQPAWGSMMADLVPEELRGRFFGGRNRITGFIAMIFSYVAGGILQLLTGDVRLGFSIIFAGALVSRLVSLYFLAQMHEPFATQTRPHGQASLLQISRGLLGSNVGRFIVLHALMNFSATTAGPFFSPYMLKDLKFSYITYTIVNSAATLSTLAFMTYWGRRSDRAGNVKVLKLTSFLVPIVPVLWTLSGNFYWILFVQMFSGLAWAGFSLASSLFIYDASPQQNRTRYIAIYNATMYLGVSLGSLSGGIIAPHLPRIMGSYFLSIFIVSGLLRAGVAALIARQLTEVRNVPPVATRDLLFDGIPFRTFTGIPGQLSAVWRRLRGKRRD